MSSTPEPEEPGGRQQPQPNAGGSGSGSARRLRPRSVQPDYKDRHPDLDDVLGADEAGLGHCLDVAQLCSRVERTAAAQPLAATAHPAQVTAEALVAAGLRRPLLVPAMACEGGLAATRAALGLQLPAAAQLTARGLAAAIGPGHRVPTIDVATQGSGPSLTLRQLADYLRRLEAGGQQQGQQGRRGQAADRLLNVVSLSLAGTPLEDAVGAPWAVRQLDLVSCVWPPDDDPEASDDEAPPVEPERPETLLYALLGPAGAYTDWHIDMGGSAVWYHMLSGRKASSWLGDELEGLLRISLGAGDTLLLPSAWPHAVSTPEAAVAVGGNFLTALDYGAIAACYRREQRLGITPKFQFPLFRRLMWYAAHSALLRLRRCLQQGVPPARAGVSAWEQLGLPALLGLLREWLQGPGGGRRAADVPAVVANPAGLLAELRRCLDAVPSAPPPPPEAQAGGAAAAAAQRATLGGEAGDAGQTDGGEGPTFDPRLGLALALEASGEAGTGNLGLALALACVDGDGETVLAAADRQQQQQQQTMEEGSDAADDGWLAIPELGGLAAAGELPLLLQDPAELQAGRQVEPAPRSGATHAAQRDARHVALAWAQQGVLGSPAGGSGTPLVLRGAGRQAGEAAAMGLQMVPLAQVGASARAPSSGEEGVRLRPAAAQRRSRRLAGGGQEQSSGLAGALGRGKQQRAAPGGDSSDWSQAGEESGSEDSSVDEARAPGRRLRPARHQKGVGQAAQQQAEPKRRRLHKAGESGGAAAPSKAKPGGAAKSGAPKQAAPPEPPPRRSRVPRAAVRAAIAAATAAAAASAVAAAPPPDAASAPAAAAPAPQPPADLQPLGRKYQLGHTVRLGKRRRPEEQPPPPATAPKHRAGAAAAAATAQAAASAPAAARGWAGRGPASAPAAAQPASPVGALAGGPAAAGAPRLSPGDPRAALLAGSVPPPPQQLASPLRQQQPPRPSHGRERRGDQRAQAPRGGQRVVSEREAERQRAAAEELAREVAALSAALRREEELLAQVRAGVVALPDGGAKLAAATAQRRETLRHRADAAAGRALSYRDPGSGAVQGPFTPAELEKLVRVGAVARDTAVTHQQRGVMTLPEALALPEPLAAQLLREREQQLGPQPGQARGGRQSQPAPGAGGGRQWEGGRRPARGPGRGRGGGGDGGEWRRRQLEWDERLRREAEMVAEAEAEAAMGLWTFVDGKGQPQGPFTVAELRQLHKDGVIGDEEDIWVHEEEQGLSLRIFTLLKLPGLSDAAAVRARAAAKAPPQQQQQPVEAAVGPLQGWQQGVGAQTHPPQSPPVAHTAQQRAAHGARTRQQPGRGKGSPTSDADTPSRGAGVEPYEPNPADSPEPLGHGLPAGPELQSPSRVDWDDGGAAARAAPHAAVPASQGVQAGQQQGAGTAAGLRAAGDFPAGFAPRVALPEVAAQVLRQAPPHAGSSAGQPAQAPGSPCSEGSMDIDEEPAAAQNSRAPPHPSGDAEEPPPPPLLPAQAGAPAVLVPWQQQPVASTAHSLRPSGHVIGNVPTQPLPWQQQQQQGPQAAFAPAAMPHQLPAPAQQPGTQQVQHGAPQWVVQPGPAGHQPHQQHAPWSVAPAVPPKQQQALQTAAASDLDGGLFFAAQAPAPLQASGGPAGGMLPAGREPPVQAGFAPRLHQVAGAAEYHQPAFQQQQQLGLLPPGMAVRPAMHAAQTVQLQLVGHPPQAQQAPYAAQPALAYGMHQAGAPRAMFRQQGHRY